jgi:hypothetical protein
MPLVSGKITRRTENSEPRFWRRPPIPAVFFTHGSIYRTGRGRRALYWVCSINSFDGTPMWAYMPPAQNKELYGL